jgi:hypothetical protein
VITRISVNIPSISPAKVEAAGGSHQLMGGSPYLAA